MFKAITVKNSTKMGHFEVEQVKQHVPNCINSFIQLILHSQSPTVGLTGTHQTQMSYSFWLSECLSRLGFQI